MNLSEQGRAELHAALRPEVYDGSVSWRAQMVLWYDEGYRKGEIATMSGTSRPTVDKWLKRYERFGLEGLVDRNSPGGPRQIPDWIRLKRGVKLWRVVVAGVTEAGLEFHLAAGPAQHATRHPHHRH